MGIKEDLKDFRPDPLVEQMSERIKKLEAEVVENFEVWSEQQRHANYLISRIEVLEENQRWINEVGRPNHPDDERPWVPAYLDCRARIKALEEGIGQINELISNRENAVLLGPGWTIATIQNIIDKLLPDPAQEKAGRKERE